MCSSSIKPLVSIPIPFCDATTIDEDLILIPSKGQFLENFTGGTGLHLAIKTANESVIEFDHRGLKISLVNEVKWRQCLRLNFIDKFFESFKDLDVSHSTQAWNSAAINICCRKDTDWPRDQYDREEKNCLDFVLSFVNELLNILSKNSYYSDYITSNSFKTRDKISFCNHFVLPETEKAAKYLIHYHKLNLDEI